MIFHFKQKNPKKKFCGGRLHIKLVGLLADPLLMSIEILSNSFSIESKELLKILVNMTFD